MVTCNFNEKKPSLDEKKTFGKKKQFWATEVIRHREAVSYRGVLAV